MVILIIVSRLLRVSIDYIVALYTVHLRVVHEEQVWHVEHVLPCPSAPSRIALPHWLGYQATETPHGLPMTVTAVVVMAAVDHLLHRRLLTVRHFLVVVHVACSTLPILVYLVLYFLTLAVFTTATRVSHLVSFYSDLLFYKKS